MIMIRKTFFSAVIAGAFAAIALYGAPANAADGEPAPRLIVSGEGTAMVAPDMAILSLTVTREADTARAALDANSTAMAEVLAAMKSEDIEDRDLQTSNFSIEPKYYYPQKSSNGENEPPRIVGYIVRNSLTVRVRDIDRLGAIIDTSVTLGVNQGGNISFTNDDPSATITEARIAAVKDAMAKARTLAEAAGVGLGMVMEISEHSSAQPPEPLARVRSAMVEAAKAVPVAAGENAYTVTVNMTFAIEQ